MILTAHRIAYRTACSTAYAAVASAALIGIAPAVQAQQLVPADSRIAFTITQMGVPVEGEFKRFEARIQLDPKQPAAGSVSFAIDTASATFGTPELDGELPKPEWLSAAKFPKAEFISTAIRSTGKGQFEVTGQLSIKGQKQALKVPVQLQQAAGRTTATGSFTIKRLDFRIGEGDWTDTSMLINPVKVDFKLLLTGMAPL
jgi:polyisoprenoid-binding protein YceI